MVFGLIRNCPLDTEPDCNWYCAAWSSSLVLVLVLLLISISTINIGFPILVQYLPNTFLTFYSSPHSSPCCACTWCVFPYHLCPNFSSFSQPPLIDCSVEANIPEVSLEMLIQVRIFLLRRTRTECFSMLTERCPSFCGVYFLVAVLRCKSHLT